MQLLNQHRRCIEQSLWLIVVTIAKAKAMKRTACKICYK